MNNLNGIKLLIFDVDGTIAAWKSSELYKTAVYFFGQLWDLPNKPFIALASNQGGVGLRYWMELGGFGNPDEYPTQKQVEERLWQLSESIRRLSNCKVEVYKAYMYKSRDGNWSPMRENKPEWRVSYRKPNSGMLLAAMVEYGVLADQTLMIGDRNEDKDAAKNAGCHFMPVSEFLFSEIGFDPLSILKQA